MDAESWNIFDRKCSKYLVNGSEDWNRINDSRSSHFFRACISFSPSIDLRDTSPTSASRWRSLISRRRMTHFSILIDTEGLKYPKLVCIQRILDPSETLLTCFQWLKFSHTRSANCTGLLTFLTMAFDNLVVSCLEHITLLHPKLSVISLATHLLDSSYLTVDIRFGQHGCTVRINSNMRGVTDSIWTRATAD